MVAFMRPAITTRLSTMKLLTWLTPLLFFLSLPLLPAYAHAQSSESPTYETHIYSAAAEEPLELDLYLPSGKTPRHRPLVLFVHGGGFYTGTRKEENIHHFCDSLRMAGFVVANVSYRLYLKGQSFHCDQPIPNKVKAIASAAKDLRLATRWLLDRKDHFMIDASQVFVSGSSAGAEAVFEAVYASSGDAILSTSDLPVGFRYKGMLAFAGAALSLDAITPDTALPTLMYHGSCDALVPYGTAIHHYCPKGSPGALLLHGSWSVHQHLETLNVASVLVTTCGGKHGSAVWPIERDLPSIISFLRSVVSGDLLPEHRVIPGNGKPCKYGNWEHCNP